MLRDDYVLRLIERLGATLIALRNRILRRAREDVAITAEIQEIARQAGLDLAVARTLGPEMLLMWLAPTGEADPARLWLMAELLYLEALAGRASGGTEWRADMKRALAVLSRVPSEWRPRDELAAAGERIAEIRALLDGQAPT